MNVLILAIALQWVQVVPVDSVEVNITRFDTVQELAQAVQENYGTVRGADLRTGHAALYRGTESGNFRCEVYIVRQARQSVEDRLLAHEMRHCNGWAH